MADAAPAPTDDLEATYRQLLQQTVAPPPVALPQGPTPSPHEGRGWLSLLGEALGGGQQYGTPAEREQGGISALGALGQRMLEASDYSYNRHSLGSIIGQGMGAAQQSLAGTQQVSAAQQAANLDYQKQQQELQLARIKEAVPILTQLRELQKQKALAGLGSPLGPAANTSIGAVGGDTYEGAIGGHEGTGKNPNSSALGTGQFLESTWQAFAAANPDLFKGMSPAQVLAARTDPALGTRAITWLAQQNADALTKAGVTPTGPSLGVAHYLGAGATAKLWAAPDNTPVAGFVSADAVKANPELATMTVGQLKQRYANTPAPAFLATAKPGSPPASTTAAVPPSVTVGDQAHPELAPGPPGSTGGAPTSLGAAIGAIDAGKPQYTVNPPPQIKAQPIPAGKVAGNVAAMQEGIKLAQASRTQPDGSVLAAGPAAPTGGFTAGAGSYGTTTTPPAVAAPQPATQAQQPPPSTPVVTTGAIPRSTPDAVPDTFEEYQAQHPIVPSDEDRAGFSTAPDAAQIAVLQKQAQIAKYAMDVARTQGDAAGLAKASEAYNTILASENTIRENAGKAGADRRAAFMKDQGANQFNAWKAAQDEKQKRITQQQQNDAASKLEQQRNKGQIDLEQAKTENAYTLEERKRFATDRDGARSSIDNLRMLRALSDNAGTTTPLDNIVVGNMTGRDFMSQIGMGTQAQQEKWGAQQAFIAAKNQMVIELRKGVQMGQLSDRDMSFLQAMGPDLLQKPETRTSILQLLENAQIRKLRYADSVEELHDGGMSWGKAKREADKQLGPILPEVPKDYPTWSGAQKREFFQQHIPSRTIYRNSDGDLAVAP